MRNRVRVSATGVLVSGAVALLGGILAATTAFATPAAPSDIVIDSNFQVVDNFVNAVEVANGIDVTGSFAVEIPPVTAVKVEIVNSATCFSGAAQHAPANGMYTLATLTSPTTFKATFNVSGFSEGAVLCARARSSSDGTNFGPNGTSAIKPVKDTIVNRGTVDMVDPLNDGFLNLAEQTAGSVSANFTAADADATNADTWYGPAGLATNYSDPSCGAVPTGLGDYTPPASGNVILTTACATSIPEGDVFSLNAKWKDDAGNVSGIASESVPPPPAICPVASCPLKKDTIGPALPTVNIVTDPITVANVATTLVNVGAEANSRINLSLTSGASLTQVKLATLPTIGFTFNATTLTDCSASKVGDLSEIRPNCVVASATAVDTAGNASGAGTDVAYKDATAPLAPVVAIDPNSIQTDVNTVVELETTGESWTAVAHTLSDQDPGTGNISAASNTENLGYVALYVDTAPLTDGIVTARTTLTDGVGNVSPAGLATATKGLTTGSVVVTSPAANSLNTSMPSTRIAGTATPSTPTVPPAVPPAPPTYSTTVRVDVFEVSTAGNEAILRNIVVNEFGAWSGNYRFLTSGEKTIYARKVGDTLGSAVRIFKVDAVAPTATKSQLDYSTFTPGQPILIDGTARDDFSGVAAVEIEVYSGTTPDVRPGANPQDTQIRLSTTPYSDLAATCAACATFQKNVLWSYDFTGTLAKGTYTIDVTPIDRAGNRAVQPQRFNIIVLG